MTLIFFVNTDPGGLPQYNLQRRGLVNITCDAFNICRTELADHEEYWQALLGTYALVEWGGWTVEDD